MTSFPSTFAISSILSQTVATGQTALGNDEIELSTGRFADVGLQLGAETGQSVSMRAQESLLQTITSSNNTVSTTLSSSQNILSNLQSTAQNFLQTLIEGGSSGNSTAGELQSTAGSNLQTLVNQLNTNVNGQFIFGGTNSGTAPLTNGSNAVTTAFSNFLGTVGATASTVTPAQMQTFLTGTGPGDLPAQFTGTDWTANWSSASDTPIATQISPSQTVVTSASANQSAFQQLAQAYSTVADLSTSDLSAQAFQTVVSSAETTIQSAISGLTAIQTNLGTAQSSITNANNFMSTQMSTLSTQIGNLENVDNFSVSTQATDLQTQIETAFELTSQLSQLSLTKFLGP
jgi:flagellar hook-associated protein 3 FlgL